MLSRIYLTNFPSGSELPQYIHESSSFVLVTCQRTLVLSRKKLEFKSSPQKFEELESENAYTYLLEIICGLKSKLIGENEIVSQFKVAYKDYSSSKNRDSHILIILEKLFQDSKDIRTKYLIGLSQKTYSSLARKIIISQHKAPQVLILGSGQLAEDMINQLKKKISVSIVARNRERVQELVNKHKINSLDWNDIDQQDYLCLNSHSYIINTIGTKKEVLTGKFFDGWQKNDKRCFVDLASPAPYQNAPNSDEFFYQLEDIFELGAIHEKKKRDQVNQAKAYLDQVVMKRAVILRKKLNSLQSKSTTHELNN